MRHPIRLPMVLVGVVVQCANAQEPASLDIGGMDFTPGLATTLRYDDNVTRETDDTVSSWVTFVAPSFRLSRETAKGGVAAVYTLSRGDYFSSQSDNFTDHLATVQGDLAINSRHRFAVNGRFADAHEDRGTSLSIGTGNTLARPDRYRASSFAAEYSYGAPSAKGRLELGVEQHNLDYDGDEVRTQIRDRDKLTLSGRFYYQVAPRTDLVFDLIHQELDYDIALDPSNPLDSDEQQYLLGLRWQTTAATTGFAKLGYQQKSFDSATRQDFNGVDWEVGVDWQPTDYTKVTLTTANDSRETNGEGNFIQTREFAVNWRHSWLQRLASVVRVDYSKDAFEGTGREDENLRVRVALEYQFRRWLSVDAGYSFDQRQSNRDLIEFDRNLFDIRLTATL